MGVGLVLTGVAVLLVSAWHHYRYTRALAAGRQRLSPPSPIFGLIVSLVLAILGLAMAWFLVAVS
jgi:hypothetical protein